MARGLAMQNLGSRMVTVIDLEDGSVYRRHYDQMHFEGKETEQIGDNTEDVSADILRELLRYMHNCSVVALSGTPTSATSEEVPSVPWTCEAADSWVPLQEPARDVGARSSRYLREMLQLRGFQHLREMSRPRYPGARKRYPEDEVLGGSPRLRSKFNDTGSQSKRSGTQMIRKDRPGDTTTKLDRCSIEPELNFLNR